MIYIRSWSLLDSTSAHISCDADKALDQSDLMFLFLFSLVLPFFICLVAYFPCFPTPVPNMSFLFSFLCHPFGLGIDCLY